MNRAKELLIFAYKDVTDGPFGLLLCFTKVVGITVMFSMIGVAGLYIFLTTAFLLCCITVVPIILMAFLWDGFWDDFQYTYSWIWIMGIIFGLVVSGVIFFPVWFVVPFIIAGIALIIAGVVFCVVTSIPVGIVVLIILLLYQCIILCRNSNKKVGDVSERNVKSYKVKPINDNSNIDIEKSINNNNNNSNTEIKDVIKKNISKIEIHEVLLPPINEKTIIFDTTFIFIPHFDKNTIVFESTFNKE